MGDCDIVVHSIDREKVHEILLGLGATCICQDQYEWKYYLNDMEFEIHDHLIYHTSKNTEKSVDFFDTSWNNVKSNSLNWNFHFIFLLYHLRKHIMGEGTGIRQFLDLAVVIKKINLNWEEIKRNIEYLEIDKFFGNVLMLLKVWFDIDVPEWPVSIEGTFVSSVTQRKFLMMAFLALVRLIIIIILS